MTFPQMLEHTLPQLKLLNRAAARVRAANGLLALKIATAAACAPWSKGQPRMVIETQRELKKSLNE